MDILFVFSLPRSGSTLLQRLLNTSASMKTTPESWVMLPQLSARKRGVSYSVYSSRHCKLAIDEFIESEVGEDVYRGILREFYLNLFQASCGDARYFIEKTPRNLLIAEEVNDVFGSDAKYIYLVRNPIAIACSMITTWGDGYWNLYAYEQDFFECLDCLVKTYNKDKHLLVKYEDLVSGSEPLFQSISDYLGVNRAEFDVGKLDVLHGRMGDPTGQYEYKGLNDSRAGEWCAVINTRVKVHLIRRLIKMVGQRNIESIGYDFDELLESIVLGKGGGVVAEITDMYKFLVGGLNKKFQLRLFGQLKKDGVRYLLS